MDPVSLAFAVVGLGLQLVETSVAIKEQIAAYKSAAKEISALSDKLDDIEIICQSLDVALARYNDAPKACDLLLLQKLHKIMNRCQENVSQLHNVIIKISFDQVKRRGPLNTVGVLFLKYKGTIHRYNEELDQSLQSLQLIMVASMTIMNYTAYKDIEQSPNAPTHSQDHETREYTHGTSITKTKRSDDQPIVRSKSWLRSWRSVCLFQHENVQNFCKSSSTVLGETSSFLAASPLLGLYFKVTLQSGYLSPRSIFINFPQIVDLNNDEVISPRLVSTFDSDDVTSLQALLNEAVVNSSTEVAVQGDGWSYASLLGLAILGGKSKITRFLMSQHFGLHERTLDRCQFFTKGSSNIQTANAYISLRGDSLSLDEFDELWRQGRSIEYAAFLIATCRVHYAADPDRFNDTIWNQIFKEFLFSLDFYSIYPRYGWARLMKEVIRGGFDVHRTTWAEQPFYLRGATALKAIMCSRSTPDDSFNAVRAWVTLMEQCGVDTQEYLETEIRHCSSTWDKDHWFFWDHPEFDRHERHFEVREFGGKRFPSWYQTASCKSNPVPELWGEFPQLAISARRTYYSRSYVFDETNTLGPHRAWKSLMLKDRDMWPFHWSITPEYIDMVPRFFPYYTPGGRERRQACKNGLIRALDLMEGRFERQHMERLRKSGHYKGSRLKSQMPGAWID